MSTKPESQKSRDALLSHTQQTLLQMINGYWISQMIGEAATLGIADLVADGSKTNAELAKTTGTDAPTLYRLLRALASLGVFVEDGQGLLA